MLEWFTLKHKLLPTGGSSKKSSGALNSRSPQQLIAGGRGGREGLRRFLGSGGGGAWDGGGRIRGRTSSPWALPVRPHWFLLRLGSAFAGGGGIRCLLNERQRKFA